jgi:hypothetical protein
MEENQWTNNQDKYKVANAFPLRKLFSLYSLNLVNNKMSCPFHGDRSPSFVFYEDTNSFYCFGCSAGTKAIDFISLKENVSRSSAADFILNIENFKDSLTLTENKSDQFKYNLIFSEMILSFRSKNNPIEFNEYIEKLCKVYDDMNLKYDLAEGKHKKLINKIEKLLTKFKKI